MATPDPGNPVPWYVALFSGLGLGSIIVAIVNGILNRRKTAAETDKTAAATDAIKAEVQVNLSGAAMELVTGIRDELHRMRGAHAAEISEIRSAHALEMSTLRTNHATELAKLQKALDESVFENGLLAAQCERLRSRMDAAGIPEADVVSPLPEVVV